MADSIEPNTDMEKEENNLMDENKQRIVNFVQGLSSIAEKIVGKVRNFVIIGTLSAFWLTFFIVSPFFSISIWGVITGVLL